MKRKILSIILAIALLATVAFSLTACDNGERRINPLCCFDGANVILFGEADNYWYGVTFEQRSDNLAIANQLHNQHTARYMAMDEFSGVWFCRYGLLNIALTITLTNRVDGIIYHRHRFSYYFLEEIMNALSDLFVDYSISAIAISERTNLVEVELLSNGEEACNDIRQIVAHLQALRLWQRDSVLFIIGSPPIVPDIL